MRVLQSTRPHSLVEPEQSARLTGGELVGREVTGGSVTCIVLPTPLRTHWYPWLARRITGATSPVSMAAWQQCTVVDSSSQVIACLGECGYDISKS